VSTLAYSRYELVRALRNRRFFVFSLAFPVTMFFLIAGPNRHQQLDGIPFAVYYMSGMITWGGMAAVIASGARIAAERALGWHRQLRLTPLPVRTYFAAKVMAGYLTAAMTIVLLYVAGASMGVRLPAGDWIAMTVLILVGLIPFAVLGVLLGHVLTVESMGPVLGGLTALLALVGGAWGPLVGHGVFRTLTEGVPSYWLVQAGKSATTGAGWPVAAWAVLAVWTVALLALAVRVYQRDTART
jgi:ABC-2 type transport system permease protein